MIYADIIRLCNMRVYLVVGQVDQMRAQGRGDLLFQHQRLCGLDLLNCRVGSDHSAGLLVKGACVGEHVNAHIADSLHIRNVADQATT